MPKIIINGKEIEFEKGMTVLQACELAEVLKYQDFVIMKSYLLLEIAECVLLNWKNHQNQLLHVRCLLTEGMNIKTNTAFVKKLEKELWSFCSLIIH